MALNCSNSGQSQPFCGDHWRSRGLPDQSERRKLFRLIIGRSLFEDLSWFACGCHLFFPSDSICFLNKTPQACIRSLLMVASWTCVTPASSIAGHLDFVVLCAMSIQESWRFRGGTGGRYPFSPVYFRWPEKPYGQILPSFPPCRAMHWTQISASGLQICTKRKWCHIKVWHLLMFCLMWHDCDYVLQVQTVFLWEMPFMSSWA